MFFYKHDVIEHPQEKLEEYKAKLQSWQPDVCEGLSFSINDAGQWFFGGSLVQRPEMIRLFASLLVKEGESYFIVSPIEKIPVKVAGVPFIIHHYEIKSEDLLFFTTAGDTLIFNGDSQFDLVDDEPVIEVRGGLLAKLDRQVYYQLAEQGELIEEDGKVLLEIVVNKKKVCLMQTSLM